MNIIYAVNIKKFIKNIYTDTSPQIHSMKIESNDNGKLNTSVYMKEPHTYTREDVAEIKYPERGDYVQFVFDTKHNGWLAHSEYFNNTAYNSEDICTAAYDRATYSGHYSYKYEKNLDKSNIIFDDAESVINRIIDNANTVYITPFSKKYHYSINCAGKNATAVKLDQLNEDFEPCKKCIE